MLLADKIVTLRKRCRLVTGELAAQLGVSRPVGVEMGGRASPVPRYAEGRADEPPGSASRPITY